MSRLGFVFDTAGTGSSLINNAESASDGEIGGYIGLGADTAVVAQMFLPPSWVTPIINAGLRGIFAMNLITGLGKDPESGGRFEQGAQQFTSVSTTLDTAVPTRWEGTAAQAYAQRNAAQQQRANTMAEIDTSVQQIVEMQADQVDRTRTVLNYAATGLGYAIVPAMLAKVKPIVGEAISLKIQLAAVAIAMPPCGIAMAALSAASAANAAKLFQAVGQYKQVASMSPSGGPAPTASPTPKPPEPQQPQAPERPEAAPIPPATAPSGGGPAGGGAPGGGAPSGGAPSGGGGSHSNAPEMPSVPSMPSAGGLGPGMPRAGMPGSGGIPSGGMPGGGGGMPGAGLGGLAGGLAGSLAAMAGQIAQTVRDQQAQERSVAEQEAAELVAAEEQVADDESDQQPVELAQATVAESPGERAPVHDTATPQNRPASTYPR